MRLDETLFEGPPCHLATFANEIPRRSAAEWVLVISCFSIGSCVVKFGRFLPLSIPANRAAESPRRGSSSIEMSHVPAMLEGTRLPQLR